MATHKCTHLPVFSINSLAYNYRTHSILTQKQLHRQAKQQAQQQNPRKRNTHPKSVTQTSNQNPTKRKQQQTPTKQINSNKHQSNTTIKSQSALKYPK